MGERRLSATSFQAVHNTATRGGTTSATRAAEERIGQGFGLDPLVDPKGLPHLGPVRLSLPRFVEQNGLWRLTVGLPMPVETLLDTTASMGDNVDLAFAALMGEYEMLTTGTAPVLGRYDLQVATAIFNDVEDRHRRTGAVVLARSQFEMEEKIAEQMAMLVPGRDGCGNYKEDSQFGLFAAAYLTYAAINRWGLRYYHFTVSDEPIVPRIDYQWVETIFGDNVLDRLRENGHDFTALTLPDTAQTVKDLQARAHAFFLQVPGWHGGERRVTDQWTELYGADHTVMLPGGTRYLHYVKAVIMGLTEGVLDLESAEKFLHHHGLDALVARQIVEAVMHIPLAAQALAPSFDTIPRAGDLFREKTDLKPVDPNEVLALQAENEGQGPNWL